jgi:putative copper export protein
MTVSTPQQIRNRHSDQRFAAIVTFAAGCLVAGPILAVTGLIQGMQSTGQSGGGQMVMLLAGLALCLAPLALGALIVARRSMRWYGAWKRSLPPAERALVEVAQFAALAGGAVAWRRHNDRVSARNTASTLGGD